MVLARDAHVEDLIRKDLTEILADHLNKAIGDLVEETVDRMIEAEQAKQLRLVLAECHATLAFEQAAPIASEQLLEQLIISQVKQIAAQGLSHEQTMTALN